MKKAIIVGSQGQDGRWLFEQLTARHYSVIGLGRTNFRETNVDAATARLALFKENAVVDILNPDQIRTLVDEYKPDEVYYLAAYHHSAEAKPIATASLYERSHDIHVRGLLNFLNAAESLNPQCRFFYAASSHVFGDPPSTFLTEETPLNPSCIYGITKATAVECCRFYRKQHGLFVSVGFLFNHESPYRRPDFLSQKIARAAVAIKSGKETQLTLGDLSAIVDWGDASDYTRAMQHILMLETSEDFIIASGIPRTVTDFAATAFKAVGLDWNEYVSEDRNLIKKKRQPLIGDAARLRSRTSWRPFVSFEEMVFRIVRAEAAIQGLAL